MTDTITLPRAELQAALDALSTEGIGDASYRAAEALRPRLVIDVCSEKQPDVEKVAQRVEKSSQPQEKPEPVAWLDPDFPAAIRALGDDDE